MAELSRVLRPGGTMAVTVPRFGPEAVNWALSNDYHDVPGGHVRIYRRSTLAGPAAARRAASRGQPPRPRTALALLVAALRGGAPARRPPRSFAPITGSSSGTSPAPAPHAGNRAPVEPVPGQEPRRLPGEAFMTRTEGTLPLAGRVTEVEPMLVDRPAPSTVPEVLGVISAAGRGGDSGVDRRRAAPRRDDPVVRGRALRSLEPRGVGHGARRRRSPQRSHARLPVAGRRAAPRRVLVQLLPGRLRGERPPSRHQRVRLCGHRGLAQLPGHRRCRRAAFDVARDRQGALLRVALPARGRSHPVVRRPRRAPRALPAAHRVVVDLPRPALRCGLPPSPSGDERPDWELAAGRLAHAIAHRARVFEPKHEFAMDWYYPVLSGALSGEAAAARIDAWWDTFVMDGRGVRCVSTGRG